MSDVEAVGEAMAGGILARTLEPATGAGAGAVGADGHTHETRCLNCATPLAGAYCHGCGQHAHVHRTLGAFFHDLVHGVLHVDSKLWRTLPLLAWRPGELTRRYIDGQRARFVSPMALFLFTIFLSFAILNAFGDRITLANFAGNNSSPLEQAEFEARSLIVTSEARLAEARAEGKPTARIEADLRDARDDADVIARMRDKGIASVAMTETEKGKVAVGKAEVEGDRTLVALVNSFRENPALTLYKVQSNAYKFSWLLIPISVPFLWLLFPFSRRFRLYDHTVFVTYSITFMTVLVLGAILAGTVGSPMTSLLIMLYMPFHMYRQLKGSYGLSRAGAIVRTFLLSIFSLTALILFAIAIIAVAAG